MFDPSLSLSRSLHRRHSAGDITQWIMNAVLHELDYNLDDADVEFLAQLNRSKRTKRSRIVCLFLAQGFLRRYSSRQAAHQRRTIGECDHHSRIFYSRENPCLTAAKVVRRRRRHCLRHLSPARCGRRQCNGLLRTMPYLCASTLLRYLRCSHW